MNRLACGYQAARQADQDPPGRRGRHESQPLCNEEANIIMFWIALIIALWALQKV